MPELLVQLTAALSDRYTIDRQIGAGGMATVYLARDVKHDRKVALKVLNPDLGIVLGADRFLSEIRVTANLQHPNLLPLFDSGAADGLLYYVMPYVEGESLRGLLTREKQLPIEDALRIATAVASALDYAHRHGVIHRDLKPENILMHEGQALIADFGIALAVSNAGGNRITQTGLSLGTPQYMSPEQATGDRVIDGRTDIYSLGAVLYEMLTGDPPHVGSTSQAVIARVLTEKPRSVRSTRPNVPEQVEWAVERALEKLPADRFGTAHEFADALAGRGAQSAASYSASGTATASRRPVRPSWRQTMRQPVTIAAAVGALAIGVAASAMWLRGRAPAPDTTVRFQLVVPVEQGGVPVAAVFAMSPDGKLLVYRAAAAGGTSRLYVRRLDEQSGRAVSGSDNALGPVFSPDGRWLAFASGGQLKKIDMGGGAPLRIADLQGALPGMAWAGNTLVVGGTTLRALPADGGVLTSLTKVDSSRGEASHRWPVVLPDGQTLLFTVWGRGGLAGARIAVVSLKDGRHTTLDVRGGAALGMAGGLLIYHDGQDALRGVPFDAKRRRVTGSSIPLVEGVAYTIQGAVRAALSQSGTLVYAAGGAGILERELVAVGMDGSERLVTTLRRGFSFPRYSPDGRRIVVAIAGDSATEIWTYDRLSQTLSLVTRGANSTRPEWAPDGKSVVFSSSRRGRFEMWRQPTDGSGPAELLQPAGSTGDPVQGLLTADQRHLIYRTGYNPIPDDLWYRSLSGDTTSKPLAADPAFTERNPALSPDGRWVAYSANESGSPQLYVRPFPGPGPRYAVSVDGGNSPVWSRDGRKLFYRAGNRMEQATVVLSPEFSVTRRVLFERPYVEDQWHRSYDLSPDGKHFLFVRNVGAVEQATTFVVHNWAAEVRARRGKN